MDFPNQCTIKKTGITGLDSGSELQTPGTYPKSPPSFIGETHP